MNAQEIIRYISEAEKKTPVKLYIKEKRPIDYGEAQVFGAGDKIEQQFNAIPAGQPRSWERNKK